MFKNKQETQQELTITGTTYDLYHDMLKQPHLLIAGATGSGKSVVINALMYTALFKQPGEVLFILIDPKRVELVDYKYMPHTLVYASEQYEMINALKFALDFTERRFAEMQAKRIKNMTAAMFI